jgi:hypothetical protein
MHKQPIGKHKELIMNKPFLVMSFPDMGREIWAKYDESAELYELFYSEECDDYCGCADTKAECKAVAREIANEWMN